MTTILSIAPSFFLSYFIFVLFSIQRCLLICATKSEGSQGQVSEGLGMSAAQTEESALRYYDHGASRRVKIQSAGPGADLPYPSEPQPTTR